MQHGTVPTIHRRLSFLLGLALASGTTAAQVECLTNPSPPDYWATILSGQFTFVMNVYPDANTVCEGFTASTSTAQAAAAFIPPPPDPCTLNWEHSSGLYVDADATSVCNGSASAGYVTSIGDVFTSARAQASATAQNQFVYTVNSLWSGELIFVRSPGFNDCNCTALSVATTSSAAAQASSHRVFDAVDPKLPTEVEVVIRITAAGSWSLDTAQGQTGNYMLAYACPISAYSCFPWYPYDLENPWSPPGTGARLEIVDARVVLTITDGSGPSTTVSRGVMSRFDGAPTTRLGLFADAAFASDADGNFSANSFTVPVGGVITGLESVSTELKIDRFRVHDADIDGDGIHCWTDRVRMSRSIGTSISDAAYRARGDFDLDGDIDASDLNAFNAIHDVQSELNAPCQSPCPGDANIDGAINYNDVTSVLTNYGSSGPQGDADRNGTVNFGDVTSVLNNFGQPCL